MQQNGTTSDQYQQLFAFCLQGVALSINSGFLGNLMNLASSFYLMHQSFVTNVHPSPGQVCVFVCIGGGGGAILGINAGILSLRYQGLSAYRTA